VAVTAGYMHAGPAKEFFAKMDAANVDLKAFTDDFYFKQQARVPASRFRPRPRPFPRYPEAVMKARA